MAAASRRRIRGTIIICIVMSFFIALICTISPLSQQSIQFFTDFSFQFSLSPAAVCSEVCLLLRGYPPLGSVATEGVLSVGYMHVCAFYTASEDRITLPEA